MIKRFDEFAERKKIFLERFDEFSKNRERKKRFKKKLNRLDKKSYETDSKRSDRFKQLVPYYHGFSTAFNSKFC